MLGPLIGQLGRRTTAPANIGSLMVVKGSYPATYQTGTFNFNPSLGGGTVSFVGHETYNNNGGWGPNYLFDNTQTSLDWCNQPGATPFGQFTFPRAVTMRRIYIIPRSAGDNFAASVTVKVDGVSLGTFTPTTISNADGQTLSYSGTAYRIDLNSSGTVWRLDFASGNSYVGEIEFWGN